MTHNGGTTRATGTTGTTGTPGAAVRAVNRLTSRWATTLPADGGTAFSAPGVWPLLAFLADGAGGAAREELADAVGLPACEAADAARRLLSAMSAMRGVDAAIGLWTQRTLTLRDAWLDGLPVAALGVLTGDADADAAALDAWAAERTGGQIQRLPARPDQDTGLVLAGALALRTDWFRPFDEGAMWPEAGPWKGRALKSLSRVSSLLDRVGFTETADGCVTRLMVLGDTGIDVHLLLGEEGMPPGQVLGAGVGMLAPGLAVTSGPLLPLGDVAPGLSVRRELNTRPRPPRLYATTVPFALTADHDLLAEPELFGLGTARRRSAQHFPGVSAEPLAISGGRQTTTAAFGALGFRAASVTALMGIGAGVPELRYRITEVHATFDRPFGFLAVERRSRLVLAAGWVTDPEPYREDEESDDSDDEEDYDDEYDEGG
ncbi:serpin family protein [Streptomyces flavofungini]|uniref:serpin family protein n=1 Tax=Streptomyces flavofungini TaxID=68200 RepID=UPI0034DE2E2A